MANAPSPFRAPAALPDTRDRAGRLTASAVFPAGWPGYDAIHVALAPDSGGPDAAERVRVVRAQAPRSTAAPGAAPVLCLHGWGASAYGYRFILDGLAAAGIIAYAADLRGHGWSDKPLAGDAYTPDALARWTLRLCDALALDRIVLVGHSLGGAIALHAARLAPDRIAALALIAPLGLDTVARIAHFRRLSPDALDTWLPRLANVRAGTAVALRSAYGRIARPTARDVDEYWAPTANPAFARAACRVLHADRWAALDCDTLAGLTLPVEVVAGSRDNLLHVRSIAAATACLPHGALDVVQNAGHVLADEVPDRVLAAIRRAHAATDGARDG